MTDTSDIAMRSCWECNGAHEHLKQAPGRFYCLWCGRYFEGGRFQGEDGVEPGS
jgi:hypothetical protein